MTDMEIIDFVAWLQKQGITLCRRWDSDWGEDDWVAVSMPIEELLEKYHAQKPE